MVPFTYKRSTTVTVDLRISCAAIVVFRVNILEIICVGLSGMPC